MFFLELHKNRGRLIHPRTYSNGSYGPLWPCGTSVETCTASGVVRTRMEHIPAPWSIFKRAMSKTDSFLSLAARAWHLPQIVGRSTALSDLSEIPEGTFHRAGNRSDLSWAISLHVNIQGIFPHHPLDPLSDFLLHVHVSLVLRSPEEDTTLQLWPHHYSVVFPKGLDSASEYKWVKYCKPFCSKYWCSCKLSLGICCFLSLWKYWMFVTVTAVWGIWWFLSFSQGRISQLRYKN